MAVGDAISFIHKDGRIIPIRGASSAIRASRAAVGAAGVVAHVKERRQPKSKFKAVADQVTRRNQPIKPNKAMKYGSMALSAVEGAATGLALGHGFKVGAAAHIAGLGLEAGTVGLAAGAYAGRGKFKQRSVAIAKQEATNQAIGWGVYGASILGRKAGREALVANAKTVASYAGKVLKIGRKILGAVE